MDTGGVKLVRRRLINEMVFMADVHYTAKHMANGFEESYSKLHYRKNNSLSGWQLIGTVAKQ
jgi:methanogenic corrinoid protein MtbC1